MEFRVHRLSQKASSESKRTKHLSGWKGNGAMKYLKIVLILVLVGVSNPVVADLKIRFWSDRDGDIEHWTGMRFMMNPDGSNPVNLNKLFRVPGSLSWSPDRTKILFVSRRTGNNEIFVMAADGSNPVQLTNHPESDGVPRWSPDGTKILWWRSGHIIGSEIHVMDADGSNQRNLGKGRNPKWSPDGTKIGFTETGGWGNLFIMNADGSGRFQLTGWVMDARILSWSPDGTKVAFSENRAGAPPRFFFKDGEHVVDENGRLVMDRRRYVVFVMDIDGSNFVDLGAAIAGVDGTVWGDIDWSRDGKKIACSTGEDIFVVNADGTNPVNLTARHPRGSDHAPEWSPDGATILFHTDRDGNWEVYSMNADGSNPVNLTNHPANDKYPFWYRIDFTPVAPQDKLITTWGQIKAAAD